MSIGKWISGAVSAAVLTTGVVYTQLPTPETVYLMTGLGTYTGTAPFTETKALLEKEGYKVTILRHTDGAGLTKLPDVFVGHSMGANAALKAVNRIEGGKRPRLVISIDAGRFPLYSYGPTNKKTRCVSLYDPSHPIGGQKVLSNCENYIQKGTIHVGMPSYAKVVKATVRIIKENKDTVEATKVAVEAAKAAVKDKK